MENNKRFHIGYYTDKAKISFTGKTYESADIISALESFVQDPNAASDVTMIKYVVEMDEMGGIKPLRDEQLESVQ